MYKGKDKVVVEGEKVLESRKAYYDKLSNEEFVWGPAQSV